MAKKGYIEWIRDQRKPVLPVVDGDLTGKTVIVVGANVGIGFEAAKHFAQMNPGRLILACRNSEKGKVAIGKLEEKTGYKKAELWIIDLSRFASVSEFADKFAKDGGRLDILVMNAAIASFKYEASPDGYESTIQVNHLSTALLSILLLPSMLKTGREQSTTPRIVIVSSEVHYWTKIEKKVMDENNILGTLASKEHCTGSVMRGRYMLSKLLNVLFVRALNSHLSRSSPLIAVAVNPGYCTSELRRELTFPLSVIDRLVEMLLAFTSEEGSRQLIWASVAEEVEGGGYVSGCQMNEVSDFVIGAEGKIAQDRIWNETVGILSKADPNVATIVDQFLRDA